MLANTHAVNINECNSWSQDKTHMVLGDIFSDSVSVAVWERSTVTKAKQYFDFASDALKKGVNGVYPMHTLKSSLEVSLPNFMNKEAAIEDVYLLADMLTCLFNCNDVGLRITTLTSAMCPSFHIDNIPVRLVCTYSGSGTEWLPLEALTTFAPHSDYKRTNFGSYYLPDHIQQMNECEVGLLKGKAWEGHQHLGAVHRSCKVEAGKKRILVTMDPM